MNPQQDHVTNSSVQLCQLDKNLQPCAVGSGCLVKMENGTKLVLTVSHVTENDGNWAVQIEYDQKQGSKCYQLGGMNYLKRFTLPAFVSEDIDFSYTTVPDDLITYREILTPKGEIISKHEVACFDGPFKEAPSHKESYGFSGAVLANLTDNPETPEHRFLKAELRSYRELKYDRTEGDFHVFKLPFDHPGHEHFRGCSGAPIVSSGGIPIALVSNGRIDTNEIYGVALDRLMIAVEATVTV